MTGIVRISELGFSEQDKTAAIQSDASNLWKNGFPFAKGVGSGGTLT